MIGQLKRLLIVLPAAVIGGAETLSATLAHGLPGVNVTVLTQRAVAGTFDPGAIRLIPFDDYGLNAPYDYGLPNAWRYAQVLSKVVASERPDAVLAVMHAASIFLALASLAHPRLFAGVRRVGSIHGQVSAYFKSLGRPMSRAERLFVSLMLARLHRVVLPSKGVLDDLAALFPRAIRRAQVIYNGVDIARIRALAQAVRPIPKEQPWIVMAARLSRQKDHATLLRAWREIADRTPARLVLVGDGEERPAIERLAQALGIADRVTITGFLDNPFPILGAADAVVLSSHYEGFGLALVEAMALGRPVIATDCPSGPAEIVQTGREGFLVAPGDSHELAERMAEILGDAALRDRMGAAGRVRAERFSQERMLSEYHDVLLG